MKDITMPAGRYYIGDLCYVLRDEVWDEVCGILSSLDRGYDGKFTLKDGRNFVIFGTAYGDGCYNDFMGRRYFVDSGTLGCVEVPDDFEGFKGSIIAKFDAEFPCYKENAVITFGHVSIDTDPRDEEEEKEYEDDEE